MIKKLNKRKKINNVTVLNAEGNVTFKNISKNATAKKRFKVDSKGCVTIPKKTKKGKYKVIIKVSANAEENSGYQRASTKVSFTVHVK